MRKEEKYEIPDTTCKNNDLPGLVRDISFGVDKSFLLTDIGSRPKQPADRIFYAVEVQSIIEISQMHTDEELDCCLEGIKEEVNPRKLLLPAQSRLKRKQEGVRSRREGGDQTDAAIRRCTALMKVQDGCAVF